MEFFKAFFFILHISLRDYFFVCVENEQKLLILFSKNKSLWASKNLNM